MTEHRSKVNTVLENTALLRERVAISEEQIALSVKMLTELICKEHTEQSLEQVYSQVCGKLSVASCADKALVCRLLCERARFTSELEASLRFADDTDIDARSRVAYVRNKRGDDAFLLLSERIKKSRAHYVGSFSDACEAVFDGKCEFCLLPIENNVSGKLYSFYSMLDKYELMIRDTVAIDGDDETQTVIFALVGKSAVPFSGIRCPYRLEFSVVRDKTEPIADVFGVAESLGAVVSSFGAQPLPYDDLKQRCYFAFDLDGESPLPLLAYMCLEHPGSTVIGLYKIHKEN